MFFIIYLHLDFLKTWKRKFFGYTQTQVKKLDGISQEEVHCLFRIFFRIQF